MKRLRAAFAFSILCLPSLLAQGNPDPTIQTLIAEVRQLRLALERSAVVTPKIQIALQRVQIQQDAVTRASRELEMARGQLTKFAEEQASLAAEAKHNEEAAVREQDAARRNGLETRAKEVKSVLDQRIAGSSELRGREVELSGRLRAEQAKMDELNQRLSALEQLLEAPQQ